MSRLTTARRRLPRGDQTVSALRSSRGLPLGIAALTA
jgi:hypothetical protein